jgi:hypothetical protein
MGKKIRITTGRVLINAKLNDSETARMIVEALPIHGKAQVWGGEIYFSIDVKAKLENDSTDVLEEGQLAYWPPGKAFCIFFGPTPASQGDEIRAASAVNIVGEIHGDLADLWTVEDGADVLIELA